MALAMELKSGNTTIRIMDDFCSAPDQEKRDADIKKRIYANALAAIRANPERYYEVLARKENCSDGNGSGFLDHSRYCLAD